MKFKVKLYRDKATTPVLADFGHMCLGHMILMMHCAAKGGSADCQHLIDITAEAFAPCEGPTRADGVLPYFDRAFHYQFLGMGAWGTGNVRGVFEFLFRGDEFVQLGVQIAIHRIMLLGNLGNHRSVSKVLNEISTSIEASYKQRFPEPFSDGTTLSSTISDRVSHCFLSVKSSRLPIVTCRIGNREIWDND